MTAMTNRDAVIQSNLARIAAVEERLQKLHVEFDETIAQVQSLIEVVNADTVLIEDIGARLTDGTVAVGDFEDRIVRLEETAGIDGLP